MSDGTAAKLESSTLLSLTADIVAAYAGHAPLTATDLNDTIVAVSRALSAVHAGTAEPAKVELFPAVPVKKSVTPNYLVCLEDGKKLKMLKRHLMTAYGMTPDQYRVKWGLPSDYPMVAPSYASARSQFAKAAGLGKRPVAAPVSAEPVPAPEPTKAAAKPVARSARARKKTTA